MRAVIDTNVLVSALFWSGPPHALLEYVRGGNLTLVSSGALLAELGEVIVRPKFHNVLVLSGMSPDRMLAEIRQLSEIFEPSSLPQPVCRDVDDDALLALGVAAHVDLIISGDADVMAEAGLRAESGIDGTCPLFGT